MTLSRRQFIAVSGGAFVVVGMSGPVVLAPPPEDGYELWLRYRLVEDSALRAAYRSALTHIVAPGTPGPIRSAARELVRGLSGLLGQAVPEEGMPSHHGAIVIGTPETSSLVAQYASPAELAAQGPEGYILRRLTVSGYDSVLVASSGARGVLYGAFHLLRLVQTHRPLTGLNIAERPATPRRFVNHWDNLSRSVERGYAGKSIFKWDELPTLDQRYTDYARALASIGINGTVVNNVNANSFFLSSNFLPRAAALAGVLREWGITFHLSANFASPMNLDDLPTADPFDARVRAWWRDKATEIYSLIPDFGGFLVKASSEGQPGPVDPYRRTHADGANMIAEALAPHGGTVMWRSFVHHGYSTDWAREQYETFRPLDGIFADNAIVQTKNGPIDFQVREPVNPLFGGLPNTNQMMELQITQEYTGQGTHLCYLVPWWKQVLDFDTRRPGPVRQIIDGLAGVINFGDDRNWTGHPLHAANTHGYGRLAWSPTLGASEIAEEWVRMTYGPRALDLTGILTSSWRIYEDYTIPLGIGVHMVIPGQHFDPDPRAFEGQSHNTTTTGTGPDFDRSAFRGFYHQYWKDLFDSLDTCPDELLLFMHLVPFTHVLHSGKTVIQHIYDTHFGGLEDAQGLRTRWQALSDVVDSGRHAQALERFDRQIAHATRWRDTFVGYFFERSRIPDQRRSWLQTDPRPALPILYSGRANVVPIGVGNVSGANVPVRGRLVTPSGWSSSPAAQVSIGPGAFGTLNLPVTPPPGPATAALDLDLEPTDRLRLLTTGLSFVVAPHPDTCLLALDAGTAGSQLTTGYTRLSPATLWSAGAQLGWVGAGPQARDRGPRVDALRRDHCYDVPTRTLRIALPPGQHDVAVLHGDSASATGFTIIKFEGQTVGGVWFLPYGEVYWSKFTLNGGVQGREVDLEFSGVDNQQWRMNALTVLDPGRFSLALDAGMAASPLAAGYARLTPASTWDARVGFGWVGTAPQSRDRGDALDALRRDFCNDVAARTLRVALPPGQHDMALLVGDGGTASHPTYVTVDGRRVASVSALPWGAFSWVTFALTGGRDVDLVLSSDSGQHWHLNALEIVNPSRLALALDAGYAGSPLAAGYSRLAPETAWDPARGFGWVGTAPQSRDRGSGFDALRRDFCNDIPVRTLRLAVPAGQHDMAALIGDGTVRSHPTFISVGGQRVAESSLLPGGTYAWLNFTLDGGATGREVDLEFASIEAEHWHLNALLMR